MGCCKIKFYYKYFVIKINFQQPHFMPWNDMLFIALFNLIYLCFCGTILTTLKYLYIKPFIRSGVMTTINCSLNCIYQVDGKCTLDNVSKNSTSVKANCIFFEEKVFKKRQKEVI